MAMLLLDHPWPITEAVPQRMEAAGVLEDFDRMFKERESLTPVPFINLEQYASLCRELDKDEVSRSYGSYFIRLVEAYVRWNEDGGNSIASPDPEPSGIPLPHTWKKALREAMTDLRDWRNPQIVVPKKRLECWERKPEVAIAIDGNPAGSRVLAVLEEYDLHPYAVSDFDPWDLQRCHLPATDSRVGKHPCRVPKHPALENVPLDELDVKLQELRRKGWHYLIGGVDKYYYIPPDDWHLAAVGKEDWRKNCKTFPRSEAGGGQGTGPVDHWGRVWIWDRTGKRHWDVQFPVRNPEDKPDYVVINHEGDLIRDP